MAAKPATAAELPGLAQSLASIPMAQTPRGGTEFGFAGESSAAASAPAKAKGEFAGMGPLLEMEPGDCFKQVEGLVKRQELTAQNHLAQDTHWTYVKLGYPWSSLTKEPNRDVYKQTLPYGASAITIQAVPNKVWDLVNKTVEALLVDFAEASAEPDDDSEEAENACDMANRFLAEDGGEQGTNDYALFHDRVTRAMTCATSYLECWSDPTGGGCVPLQIKAHPEAPDANNPMVGPDGAPTTDPILRYVTPEMQFTDDPSQAAQQWQPKLRAAKWGREHIRVFPESARVEDAEKVIVLGYCTLSEAKKRWKDVADMDSKALDALCDWTPTRYLPLLPPFQRARWKISDGKEQQKAGSSDERIMFYMHLYAKASPDYKKGCDIVVTGASEGLILERKLLAKDVAVTKGQKKVTESRSFEIPVVQVTPRGDPDEMDPTGRAYVEMVAGAAENNAFLAMSFAEAIDDTLHTPFAIQATSAIEGWQVDEAKASGDFLLLQSPEDKPIKLDPPDLPSTFFNMYELADEALNSMGSSERAAKGSDNSKERSGKAIQIAVSQNNVSLNGMSTAVNFARTRWSRIKIEQAMANFTTPQQISYIGEDGAYKQAQWSGVDFARVGKVTPKAGTGTLMAPDAKVQYLGNLQGAGLLPPEEAAEAARPAFAKRLGLPDNPHEQHVERCIDAWLKGPPDENWIPAYQQFTEQKIARDQYEQGQVVAQQNAAAQQVVQQQNDQLGAQEKLKQDSAIALESHKAQTGLDVERQKHAMALEAKAVDAEHTKAAAAAQPAPQVVVQPPDMSEITQVLERITQTLEVMASSKGDDTKPIADAVSRVEDVVSALAHHASGEKPPIVVPAPVVNVHPTPVHVEAPKAEKRKGGKRRIKLTPEKDGTFTAESSE